jgi:hypothetical protein
LNEKTPSDACDACPISRRACRGPPALAQQVSSFDGNAINTGTDSMVGIWENVTAPVGSCSGQSCAEGNWTAIQGGDQSGAFYQIGASSAGSNLAGIENASGCSSGDNLFEEVFWDLNNTGSDTNSWCLGGISDNAQATVLIDLPADGTEAYAYLWNGSTWVEQGYWDTGNGGNIQALSEDVAIDGSNYQLSDTQTQDGVYGLVYTGGTYYNYEFPSGNFSGIGEYDQWDYLDDALYTSGGSDNYYEVCVNTGGC